MFLGLSTASVDLIIMGGLIVALAQAALRRDPAWVIALGLPLLLCADHAGLPEGLMAWGCALYALAVVVALLVMLARAVGTPAVAGLLAALAGTALMAGTADARHLGIAAPSLHAPPLVGVRLAGLLRDVGDD